MALNIHAVWTMLIAVVLLAAAERIAEQRQRNQAVKALRSVRPLKK